MLIDFYELKSEHPYAESNFFSFLTMTEVDAISAATQCSMLLFVYALHFDDYLAKI